MDSEAREKRAFIKVATEETCPQTHNLQNREKKT